MSGPVIQVATRPTGALVALHRDGSVSEQRTKPNAISGDFSRDWYPVDTTGVEGRIVQVIARPMQPALVAVTADGALWEQYQHPTDRQGVYRFRRLDQPE